MRYMACMCMEWAEPWDVPASGMPDVCCRCLAALLELLRDERGAAWCSKFGCNVLVGPQVGRS